MRPLRRCQIWCKSIHGGLLDEWVKYDENFIYLYLFSETRLQVRPVDVFHAWWLKWPGLAQGCAFWGFHWYCCPFFGEIPPNSNFWGMNRRFQAKRAKYWKFHIIEITESISTKFYQTIETTKWPSWVVPIRTQQIQDGGRPPFCKIR